MVKKNIVKKLVGLRYSRLNSVKFGLAGGILVGVCVSLMTLAGMFGMFPLLTALISDAYGSLGYSVSGVGIIFGLVYGFIDGFIGFWIFSSLYNWLIR